MYINRFILALWLCAASLNSSNFVWGQDPAGKSKDAAPAAQAPVSRLTIEVTGGESNKPIENASVYMKTLEEHTFKDKKTELNVKTNQNGVAHIPDAPTGRVLIQIVAEGWKSYGHWYDITDPKQVIKIHLDRPPKWY
ncbi:MAG TPA: carboxypeptidase-like regulatory domain-containing protein [Candidatus Acidoferrum sp.]|nr:carboxypeptidase-like regulatory domain-containing protein [Candidatus Acidoferrum sp.]